MKRPIVWLALVYALIILFIQPQARIHSILAQNKIALKAETIIKKYTCALTASVLEAMVLGEKTDIPPQVYNSMMQTGTVHILVVSGFNVGIVAFVAGILLKMFRVKRIPRIYSTAVFLIFYCCLTGASTPVLRATVMGIALIGAYLFKREPDTGNSLGLAAFCILVFNPNQLFNVGFQLSFASVAAIAFLYPKLAEISRAVKLKNVCLRFIAEGLLVSLSAWLFTAPIIAWRIHTFSPVTVLANLVIVPVATLITLSGFSLLVSGLLLPFIAPAFGAASELLVFVLISINQAMLKLPFSYLKF